MTLFHAIHGRRVTCLCVFCQKDRKNGRVQTDRQGASTETEYNDNDGENNGQLRRGRRGGDGKTDRVAISVTTADADRRRRRCRRGRFAGRSAAVERRPIWRLFEGPRGDFRIK